MTDHQVVATTLQMHGIGCAKAANDFRSGDDAHELIQPLQQVPLELGTALRTLNRASHESLIATVAITCCHSICLK